MKKINKKWINLTSTLIMVTPIITVISCGAEKKDENNSSSHKSNGSNFSNIQNTFTSKKLSEILSNAALSSSFAEKNYAKILVDNEQSIKAGDKSSMYNAVAGLINSGKYTESKIKEMIKHTYDHPSWDDVIRGGTHSKSYLATIDLINNSLPTKITSNLFGLELDLLNQKNDPSKMGIDLTFENNSIFNYEYTLTGDIDKGHNLSIKITEKNHLNDPYYSLEKIFIINDKKPSISPKVNVKNMETMSLFNLSIQSMTHVSNNSVKNIDNALMKASLEPLNYLAKTFISQHGSTAKITFDGNPLTGIPIVTEDVEHTIKLVDNKNHLIQGWKINIVGPVTPSVATKLSYSQIDAIVNASVSATPSSLNDVNIALKNAGLDTISDSFIIHLFTQPGDTLKTLVDDRPLDKSSVLDDGQPHIIKIQDSNNRDLQIWKIAAITPVVPPVVEITDSQINDIVNAALSVAPNSLNDVNIALKNAGLEEIKDTFIISLFAKPGVTTKTSFQWEFVAKSLILDDFKPHIIKIQDSKGRDLQIWNIIAKAPVVPPVVEITDSQIDAIVNASVSATPNSLNDVNIALKNAGLE
ncbi:MAG: hypothetical protein K4H23_05015, partial [Mollicutes bacterium PWAP]|nr:hypothetical protein [Mollicutes bacterium PWAP]